MKRTVIGLVLALCSALVQVSSEEFSQASVEELIRDSKCLEMENLTMDEISGYALGKNLEEAENKPQLKCFAACLFEHSGIMRECVINDERFAGGDSEKLQSLHNLLTVCKGTVTAGDRCECAHQLTKCMVDHHASAEGDN